MRKRLFAFLGSLALLLGGGMLTGLGGSAFEAKAEAENIRDFGDEEDADRMELAVSLTGSSITSTSQSFNLSMQSVKIEAWNNSTRYNNVFARIVDENYVDLNTAKAKSEEAQKNATEEHPYEPEVYEARVFNINNAGKSSKNVVLPQYINYGSPVAIFRLHVTGIDADACYDYNNLKAVSYNNIETIVIPSGYTSISANAFAGAQEAGVKIKSAEASALPGWEEDWTDAEVEYSHTEDSYSSAEKRMLSVNTTGATAFGEGKNFFVGYFDEANPENNLPLTMEYTLLDSENRVLREHCYYELPKASTTLPFDAVGTLAGKAKDDRYVDVEIPKGAHIDGESIVFHNIRRLIRDEAGTGVIFDPEARPIKAKPLISYSGVSDFSSFFSLTPDQATFIGGYSRFSVKAKANYEIYQTVNPSAYESNKALIENGTLRIRLLFSSLSSASYRVVYENRNGELVTKTFFVRTPVTATEITDGTQIGFLIKDSDVAPDFSIEKARSVQLCGFFVQADLFNATKNSIANNSKKSFRFATLDLLPDEGVAGVQILSIGAVLGIAYGSYAALFIAGAFAYYFYCKKKSRNDEFRRVNTKKFVVKSAENFLGYALILSSILFITARWAMLKNTIVVFNPLDVWVIVFTLAGAIFLGFAIKDMVISIKETMERKKKEKLHLDSDIVEDGTK